MIGGNRSGSTARARGLVRLIALLGCGGRRGRTAGCTGGLVVTGITPSGTNVPAARQIVIQFNRPVVPIGRMDRTAAEIPIEIAPPLAASGAGSIRARWRASSATASELTLATRYTLVIDEGIRAEDGATTSGVRRHEFTTERPRVELSPASRPGAAPACP